MGFKKVIIELDSRSTVLSIEGSPMVDSRHGPIIHRIQQTEKPRVACCCAALL
ncbi:hypothetical protein LINPERPRIM_LOCUS9751 [Linum perenne]